VTCGRSVISSTNKTNHQDITEIVLKVALNTKTLTMLTIETTTIYDSQILIYLSYLMLTIETTTIYDSQILIYLSYLMLTKEDIVFKILFLWRYCFYYRFMLPVFSSFRLIFIQNNISHLFFLQKQ
jgi:hypothetical protein